MYRGQICRAFDSQKSFKKRIKLLDKLERQGLREADQQFDDLLGEIVKDMQDLEGYYLRVRYETRIPLGVYSKRDYRSERGKVFADLAVYLGLIHLMRDNGLHHELWGKKRWLQAHVQQLNQVLERPREAYIIYCGDISRDGACFYCLFVFNYSSSERW